MKMIFKMAAEGTSFADITRELNRQAIATYQKIIKVLGLPDGSVR